MILNDIYTNSRTGYAPHKETRSDFQRDYDRIIFSSSFRRLQNKTQVFPLPGSVFVHNRLTHSLEVASVGRSLGSIIGGRIVDNYQTELNPESKDFYANSLYNVMAAACLCHDIGNPPFGHSGEDAIAQFFIENEDTLQSYFTDKEWQDLVYFEGNANSIRVLTHQQKGKAEGGLGLTYSTLSSIAKYPCESIAIDKNYTARKKFGFLQSEKAVFQEIAAKSGMILAQDEPLMYQRHPFVWIVEAADDICYHIMDLEDAHRLKIIETSQCENLLNDLIIDLGVSNKERLRSTLDSISDQNEKIGYLRAKSIQSLITLTAESYMEHFDDIMAGHHEVPFFEEIRRKHKSLDEIVTFSIDKIYNHRFVVEVETAGYSIIHTMLELFAPVVLKDPATLRKHDKKILQLIPDQFKYDTTSPYHKTLGLLDFISGMTDIYATDLYKAITGIEFGLRFF